MLLAASLLGAAGIQYAINGFSTLACLWQFPLLTAGMLAGLVLLFLLVLFVSTLFVDPKKMVEKPSAYFRFMLNQFCRLALFLGGGAVICRLEGIPLLTALFETASAIGTVGLSLGVTPELGQISRMILIVLMYFGRVGGLTMVFAAASGRRANPARYPQEKITVG